MGIRMGITLARNGLNWSPSTAGSAICHSRSAFRPVAQIENHDKTLKHISDKSTHRKGVLV